VVDEQYLAYRLRSVEYLGNGLRRLGVPIVEPPGGHAVYVNAKKFLPHIPASRYPGQVLVCELYRTAGIRAVEIGSLMFGKAGGKEVLPAGPGGTSDTGGGGDGAFTPAPMELVRLAMPRRVYTQSHIDFVIEVFADIVGRAKSLRGLRLVSSSQRLAHFTAKLMPETA
jgi:tryptophanase